MYKVVIVDDEPIIVEGLTKLLPWEKYDCTVAATAYNGNEGLDAMFTNRSDGGKKGLYYQKIMFESVVPYWEAEDGKLTKLQLLPVELGFGQPRSHGGLPHPEPDGGILERLAAMSAPWGTKITVEKGIGTVTL